jgi:4-amino-4-deoxy-L-arabinose transferase-like glycosyltransferase
VAGATAVGVAVRALYVLVGYRDGREPVGDALTYHLLARLLADGEGYVRPLDLIVNGRNVPSAEFPPLWPVLLALADLFGLESPTAHRLIGALLGGVTIVLVALTARLLAGPVAGVAAAVLAALHPQLVALDGGLMAEALLLPLVAGALLLATMAVQDRPAGRRSMALLAGLGALVALAALTRSEAALLVPALAVPVALVAGPGGARARLARLAVVLLPVVVLLGSWTIRTSTRLDAVVPLTTNSGTLVAGANCDEVFGGARTGQWSLRCATASLPDPITDEAAAAASIRRAGLRYAGGHVDRLPVVATVRVLRTFGAWDVSGQLRYESFEGRPYGWLWAGWLVHLVVIALAVIGAVALRRRGRPLWLLLVPIGVVIVTAALAYGNQRFRALAEPSLLVLAGTGVAALLAARPATQASVPARPDEPEERRPEPVNAVTPRILNRS